MDSEKDTQKELEELAPNLARLRKQQPEDGFSVHPSYFRELEQSVLNEVHRQPATKRRFDWSGILSWLLVGPRPVIALTTLALALAALWYLSAPAPESNLFAGSSEVAAEELRAYVHENLDDFSPGFILEVAEQDMAFETDLSLDDLSEEEIDILLDEYLEELDQETLEDIL